MFEGWGKSLSPEISWLREEQERGVNNGKGGLQRSFQKKGETIMFEPQWENNTSFT